MVLAWVFGSLSVMGRSLSSEGSLTSVPFVCVIRYFQSHVKLVDSPLIVSVGQEFTGYLRVPPKAVI